MLKNKIKYLLLLAAILILSILYNKYRMGILFLTVFTMPFMLFAVISYLYGKVTARLLTTVHVANKGEAIPISIELNNPTIFPISNLKIYLTYKNSFTDKINKKDFIVSIDHNTKTNVTVHLFSEYSGNLELNLKGIRIYDYIKLFSLKKKLNSEKRVAVLPNFYEILEDYKPNYSRNVAESEHYSRVKGGDDPSEVFTIREYREGDRLQRIHWKLSTKQDKLMIKEFSEPINCSVLLFVDLAIPSGIDTLTLIDALLECSFTLSRFFINNGQFHYFAWFDKKHGECRRIRMNKESDMFLAVDGLLQTTAFSNGAESLKNYLAEFTNEIYTDFYYITGDLSDNSLEAVSMVKSGTKHIIYIGDSRTNLAEVDNRISPMTTTDVFLNKAQEMGIGFLSVDIRNMKEAMEHFVLS